MRRKGMIIEDHGKLVLLKADDRQAIWVGGVAPPHPSLRLRRHLLLNPGDRQ